MLTFEEFSVLEIQTPDAFELVFLTEDDWNDRKCDPAYCRIEGVIVYAIFNKDLNDWLEEQGIKFLSKEWHAFQEFLLGRNFEYKKLIQKLHWKLQDREIGWIDTTDGVVIGDNNGPFAVKGSNDARIFIL